MRETMSSIMARERPTRPNPSRIGDRFIELVYSIVAIKWAYSIRRARSLVRSATLLVAPSYSLFARLAVTSANTASCRFQAELVQQISSLEIIRANRSDVIVVYDEPRRGCSSSIRTRRIFLP